MKTVLTLLALAISMIFATTVSATPVYPWLYGFESNEVGVNIDPLYPPAENADVRTATQAFLNIYNFYPDTGWTESIPPVYYRYESNGTPANALNNPEFGEFGIWPGTTVPSVGKGFGIYIDFKDNNGDYFRTSYTFNPTACDETSPDCDPYFHMDAYLVAGSAPGKLETKGLGTNGEMASLELSNPDHYAIDYILLYGGTENQWVIDNLVLPEPSTILLLAGGLITFLGYRRFRRN